MWNIVYFHVPPYSSSSHGNDQDVIDKYGEIFEKYNVVVFSGHAHLYEHLIVNDIHYFIARF